MVGIPFPAIYLVLSKLGQSLTRMAAEEQQIAQPMTAEEPPSGVKLARYFSYGQQMSHACNLMIVVYEMEQLFVAMEKFIVNYHELFTKEEMSLLLPWHSLGRFYAWIQQSSRLGSALQDLSDPDSEAQFLAAVEATPPRRAEMDFLNKIGATPWYNLQDVKQWFLTFTRPGALLALQVNHRMLQLVQDGHLRQHHCFIMMVLMQRILVSVIDWARFMQRELRTLVADTTLDDNDVETLAEKVEDVVDSIRELVQVAKSMDKFMSDRQVAIYALLDRATKTQHGEADRNELWRTLAHHIGNAEKTIKLEDEPVLQAQHAALKQQLKYKMEQIKLRNYGGNGLDPRPQYEPLHDAHDAIDASMDFDSSQHKQWPVRCIVLSKEAYDSQLWNEATAMTSGLTRTPNNDLVFVHSEIEQMIVAAPPTILQQLHASAKTPFVSEDLAWWTIGQVMLRRGLLDMDHDLLSAPWSDEPFLCSHRKHRHRVLRALARLLWPGWVCADLDELLDDDNEQLQYYRDDEQRVVVLLPLATTLQNALQLRNEHLHGLIGPVDVQTSSLQLLPLEIVHVEPWLELEEKKDEHALMHDDQDEEEKGSHRFLLGGSPELKHSRFVWMEEYPLNVPIDDQSAVELGFLLQPGDYLLLRFYLPEDAGHQDHTIVKYKQTVEQSLTDILPGVLVHIIVSYATK